METLLLLIAGHALADYPLQGDFLSKAKSRWTPIDGVPWYQAMAAHCAIHAAFVGVITGSIGLAVCEFIVHGWTDDAKCEGAISYNTDQAIHVACKVIWAAAVLFWGTP